MQNSRLLLEPKYSPDGLETLLRKTFGDLTLKTADTRVLVPAFNITRNTVIHLGLIVLKAALFVCLGYLETIHNERALFCKSWTSKYYSTWKCRHYRSGEERACLVLWRQ